MIYLDNAATTGRKPQIVINAVNNALMNLSANPGRSGHSLSQRAAMQVYKAREKTADFFGADTENVVFTSNCTTSINMVIKGVLKKGDHIIISSLEHNAVIRPIFKLQKNGMIEYDIAPVIFGDRESTVRSFQRLIKENTRMIICTHASNVTGEVLPIEQLARICREYDIIFAVDAAQSAGVLPIDMKGTGIDYLCIAPHKGLYAPMGVGVLIARRPVDNTIIEGGTGTFSNMLDQPTDMPEHLESGTVNLPGIEGVSAGIDYINGMGISRIYSHELKLVQELYDALSDISGVILYSNRPQKEAYVPVVSFNIAGSNSMEVADYLSSNGVAVRAGLHCSPLAHKALGTIDCGTVRVCPSAFNNKYEINTLIKLINNYKK